MGAGLVSLGFDYNLVLASSNNLFTPVGVLCMPKDAVTLLNF